MSRMSSDMSVLSIRIRFGGRATAFLLVALRRARSFPDNLPLNCATTCSGCSIIRILIPDDEYSSAGPTSGLEKSMSRALRRVISVKKR
jgi:hypothetical protein